mmetsp:Transcript_10849/g.39814  ORF Transcript_10849/g.39814 Transcript_10849/m.39814 type:complete len:106 (+) Transcript_10849:1076-1393(+)
MRPPSTDTLGSIQSWIMHQCAITSIECTQALLQATTNGWMIGAQVNKGEHNRTCIRSPLGDNGERKTSLLRTQQYWRWACHWQHMWQRDSWGASPNVLATLGRPL